MRLITHNMLQCHVKNCNSNNYPLKFENAEIELIEAEFNPDFLRNMLNKIDWNALTTTALQLGIKQLPAEIPADASTNESFLNLLHNVLLETHVLNGQMVCPSCSHVYKIRDGIPNMLLAEHEI
ncbi:hypothetical protein BDB01DRAFT_782294 [Pilobolus umbonatus]|nr:hypothetical protein BDB01DRAFT_782294 [Pilobolus umbonatus]